MNKGLNYGKINEMESVHLSKDTLGCLTTLAISKKSRRYKGLGE